MADGKLERRNKYVRRESGRKSQKRGGSNIYRINNELREKYSAVVCICFRTASCLDADEVFGVHHLITTLKTTWSTTWNTD